MQRAPPSANLTYRARHPRIAAQPQLPLANDDVTLVADLTHPKVGKLKTGLLRAALGADDLGRNTGLVGRKAQLTEIKYKWCFFFRRSYECPSSFEQLRCSRQLYIRYHRFMTVHSSNSRNATACNASVFYFKA